MANEVIKLNRPFIKEEIDGGQSNIIKLNKPFTQEKRETFLSVGKFPSKKPLSARDVAQAQNIMAISEATGERPSTIETQIRKATPEKAPMREFARNKGFFVEPTTKEVAEAITTPYIQAGIGAGMLTNPVSTMKGLALGIPVFKGLDFAGEKLVEALPEKTPTELKETVGAGAYLGGLAAGGKILQKMQKVNPIKLLKQAKEGYGSLLKPSASKIRNIEIRQGKNLEDFYQLAAEEQLPIKEQIVMGARTKDTRLAVEKLKPKIDEIHNELNSYLETRTNKFNLKNLAIKTKLELSKIIKNAQEREKAFSDIDDYIKAEANKYGSYEVSPLEFNELKQGMWSVAYDVLRPTTKNTARKIGFVAKEMIEKSYPDKNIRGLNEKSGKYQTLMDLLENAHGEKVPSGKLGTYSAQGAGLIIGSMLPLPGIGRAAGALAGRWAGGKINEFLTSPERISRVASKKFRQGKSK